MAVALGAQAVAPSARVLSERSGTFVGVESLMADVAAADVVFVSEQATASDPHRFVVALLEGLAVRRDVILALDAVDRAAQDALEHFQMDHLSDEEFVAQTKMAAGSRDAVLPLMKLAVARRWPIVATGGGAGMDDAAAVAAPLIQAMAIGSAGGKRPLLVSLHAGADRRVIEATSTLVLAPSPSRRAVIVQMVSVPSLEALAPGGPAPPAPAYVVYTLASR